MPTTANTPPPGNATPAPAHTTGAELQTLREAAGLSREALAELVGVQARTVKHWEHGRGGVPADVASVAQHWAQWVRATAQRLELGAREWLREGGPVLVRHQETAHMPTSDRQAGARADCHGAAVALVVQRLALEGMPARVVWFDPEAFTTWRSQHQADDTPASRAAWAQAAALPAQAIPPRGDQPPADFAPGYGLPSTGTARTRSRP